MRYLFVLLFLIISESQPVFGQTEVYPSPFLRRGWGTADGLLANHLNTFVLTDDGHLWVTSFHGITRFDGDMLTSFSSENSPGWEDDSNVRYACKTEAGIWMLILSRKKGLFLLKPGPEVTVRELGSGFTGISCTDSGRVLAVKRTRQEVDSLYTVYDGRQELWSARLGVDESAKIDRSGQVWILAPNKLYQESQAERVLVVTDSVLRHGVHDIRLLGGMTYVVSDEGIFRIEQDRLVRERAPQRVLLVSETPWSPRDAFWLSTPEALIRWTPAGETHVPVPNLGYNGESFDRGNVYHVLNDALFSITWVGDWEKRLLRYDSNRGWLSMGLEWEGVKAINAVVVDREGSYWVTTDLGLYQFIPRLVDVYGVDEGLIDPFIFAVGQDADQNAWVSTWTDGAQALIQGKWHHLSTANGLPDNHVTLFNVDARGDFWIGSIGAVSQVEDGHVTRVFPLIQGTGQRPRSLHRDHEESMWVGTHRDLIRLNLHSGHATSVFPDETVVQYNGFREDSTGVLWVATTRGWIWTKDGETWERDPVSAGIRIQAFHEDAGGTIWMSTLGDGFIRQEGDRLFRYTAEHGLPSNTTHFVLEDRKGNLWVGTEQGILRISRTSLDAVAAGQSRRLDLLLLDETEGLPSGEMMGTANGAFQDSTGKFWLATSRGVVVVDPTTIAPQPPGIQIHTLEFNEAKYAPADDLRFRPGPINRVAMAFSSLTLRPERKMMYRSRLRGFEDQWKIDPLHERHFTNLKPGVYTFEVLAIDHNGIRSQQPARLSFTILPVWHQSFWFRGFLGLFLLLGVWQIHRRRERHQQLVFESARLRDRLTERERLSRDTHDDVLNNLVMRKMQLDNLLAIEPLTTRGRELVEREMATIEEMITMHQERVWEVDPKWDRLDALANRMTRWLRSLPAHVTVRLSVIPEEGMPAHPLSGEARNHIYALFQEAIGNAIKHAGSALLEITLRYEGGWFRFVVRDHGEGFEPGAMDRQGNGIENMRYRASEAGGE